jgi:soluble lytic murein transglycosylase-like protein
LPRCARANIERSSSGRLNPPLCGNHVRCCVAAATTDDPWQEVILRPYSRLCAAATLAALLACAAPASGYVAHTVEPGETLWSIAAASNLTTRALAAANGLPEDAQVVTGTTIQIPSEAEAAAALGSSAAPAESAPAASAPAAGEAAPPRVLGAYTVEPGDTMSGIAAASGISVDQLAWMNGLDPSAPLLIGTALKLPTGSPVAEAAPAPAPAPQVVPETNPQPTPAELTAPEIGQVAAEHGVSPPLAAALAWQESGFQNNVVSPANARGVMQILPGTWTWIQGNLAEQQLDPASAADNVRAGVLYLRQLLADTGGDEALALASYYQGAASVRRVGLLPDTRRYIANVTALKSRFGG